MAETEDHGFSVTCYGTRFNIGATATADRTPYLFAVFMLFFLCRLVDEAHVESAETEEAGFFRRDELPDLSRNRVTQTQMEQLFRLHESPGSPTVFD